MTNDADIQVFIKGLNPEPKNPKDVVVPLIKNSSIGMIQGKLIQYYKWMWDETDDPKYNKMVRQIKNGKVSVPKNNLKPQDLVSPEEVKTMINLATMERDRAILAAFWEGGIRIGEMLALKDSMVVVDDIKKDVTFHIPNQPGCKTGARIIVCLEIYPHIVAWNKCNSSGLFAPLSEKQVRNIIRDLYNRAGINKPCNPHMLRHSCITYMASLGASETELSYRFWGIPHSNMVTIYIHMSQQQQSDGYRKLKGMGDKKVAINPLASRCVECGDHIISGFLCPKCEKIKTLSENEKASNSKIEFLTRELMKISKFVNENSEELLENRKIQVEIEAIKKAKQNVL
jgi:site-specific recombinase XerD